MGLPLVPGLPAPAGLAGVGAALPAAPPVGRPDPGPGLAWPDPGRGARGGRPGGGRRRGNRPTAGGRREGPDRPGPGRAGAHLGGRGQPGRRGRRRRHGDLRREGTRGVGGECAERARLRVQGDPHVLVATESAAEQHRCRRVRRGAGGGGRLPGQCARRGRRIRRRRRGRARVGAERDEQPHEPGGQHSTQHPNAGTRPGSAHAGTTIHREFPRFRVTTRRLRVAAPSRGC